VRGLGYCLERFSDSNRDSATKSADAASGHK
jgi:two-component system OmpR family response regulator